MMLFFCSGLLSGTSPLTAHFVLAQQEQGPDLWPVCGDVSGRLPVLLPWDGRGVAHVPSEVSSPYAYVH